LVATIAPHADVAPLGERVWGDTHILPRFGAGLEGFHNVITDEFVPVQADGGGIRAAEAFDRFPVAVLVSK
jgi:hypothetical protein